MDVLAGMRVFARVAETGGFSAVARELSTTQPTVSRTVAALESHLGVRLLHRSSRAVSLTDDGRAFYVRAMRALEAVAEAETSVGGRRGQPVGLLRMGAPVAFGRLHIAPRLGTFLAHHPKVDIDLSMTDAFVDPVEFGLDLVIRIGDLEDQSLVVRRLGVTRRVTVASDDYLDRRGVPSSPSDLTAHDCIVYSRLATGDRWHFEGADGPIVVKVGGRLRADNSEAVREAVSAGVGIGVAPVWLFGDEIRSGRVRIILSAFEPRPLPINAVYASRRHVAAKVRAMIAFLAAEFHASPLLRSVGPESSSAGPVSIDRSDPGVSR